LETRSRNLRKKNDTKNAKKQFMRGT
jgi:hypothetical protein